MKNAVKKTKNGWYQAIAYLGRGEKKYFTRKKKEDAVAAARLCTYLHERHTDEDRERMTRKLTRCYKCKYCSEGLYSQLNCLTCDYILIKSSKRPCAPEDCVKAGVFKERWEREAGR